MELVKCPVCGKDVSSEAEMCPHCGQRLQKIRATSENLDKIYLIWAAISIIIALTNFFAIFYTFLVDAFFALLYFIKKKELDNDHRLDTSQIKKSRKYIVIAAIIRTIIVFLFFFFVR